jgi:hypothetical protein
MFEHDSWSHWSPDPERAFREHDPSLEPFASMTRDEILEALREARGGYQWEFLLEFLLDKCSEAERDVEHFLDLLAVRGGMEDELYFLGDHACMATRLVPAGLGPVLSRADVSLGPQAVPGGASAPSAPYHHCLNGSDRI